MKAVTMTPEDIKADPDAYIQSISDVPDGEINLGHAALALAAPFYKGRSIDRYFNHLDKLADNVSTRFKALIAEGAENDASTRLAALKHILADQEGYDGDSETYDDIDNANLISVIDRRKGMPIALSILYIATGQELGWDVQGLNMPGHFICRIEKDGQRLIFDPFNRASLLNAAEMRELIKQALGEGAELSASYYDAVSNRDTLIRLQNNIKLRLIENEEYEQAVKIVESMRRIDPKEYRLLLDAGVLYARVGQNMAAARSLERYIDKAPNPRDRQEAAILLQKVRETLQ